MLTNFSIRKGLDIKLKGEADKIRKNAPESDVYSLKPSDFHNLTPKLLKREGDKVIIGTPIFHSKENKDIVVCSPVCGEIIEIRRGAKRRILEIRILPNPEESTVEIPLLSLEKASGEEVKNTLLKGGCWPFIKQRPYDVVANPLETPKAIFISGIDSAPLPVSLFFIMERFQKEVQTAVKALSKIAEVHITTLKKEKSIFDTMDGFIQHKASGPHPIGNVSTQIAKISPINKGERVWIVDAKALIQIGSLLLNGCYSPTKTIAVCGSQVRNPIYVTVKSGAKISDILTVAGLNEGENRIIQGNVLSGEKSSLDDFLGFYSHQITVIPEGKDYDFLGWQLPQFEKYSILRANMFSFLTPSKEYALDANMNGEHRAFVLTGHLDKVMPLDIYPLELIKACMAKDIDEMEALGIYEVAPEDFALTEFIDISKNEHQKLIRESLDLMIEEVG